jgi:NADPH2:quinone reductase
VDKLLGAGPIIATASTDDKLALARSLGADIAINYRQDDDWPNQVLAATDGRGVDVILESVGGDIFAKSLGALAPFGHLISFGAASSTAASLDVKNLYEANHTLTGVLLSGWFRRGSAVSDALTRLLTWIAAGDLRIRTTFPLEHAAAAHHAIHNRKTTGKVVLTPWP